MHSSTIQLRFLSTSRQWNSARLAPILHAQNLPLIDAPSTFSLFGFRMKQSQKQSQKTVAETVAETDAEQSRSEGESQLNFRHYGTDGFFDDLIDEQGRPRVGAAILTQRIEDLPDGELIQRHDGRVVPCSTWGSRSTFPTTIKVSKDLSVWHCA